jgi:hypothetical protein
MLAYNTALKNGFLDFFNKLGDLTFNRLKMSNYLKFVEAI